MHRRGDAVIGPGVDVWRIRLARQGGEVTALHALLDPVEQLALCAIADRKVGVDVEQLKHHDDMERVARHFFSGEEARTLETLFGMDRTRFFFRTWVRKEAYVKATGEGLARDTASFTVRDPPAGVTLHAPDGSRQVDDSYRVYDLPDIDDHVAAVALARGGAAPTIHFREWRDIDAANGPNRDRQ